MQLPVVFRSLSVCQFATIVYAFKWYKYTNYVLSSLTLIKHNLYTLSGFKMEGNIFALSLSICIFIYLFHFHIEYDCFHFTIYLCLFITYWHIPQSGKRNSQGNNSLCACVSAKCDCKSNRQHSTLNHHGGCAKTQTQTSKQTSGRHRYTRSGTI